MPSKYIVMSGILGVDPGFKVLGWASDTATLFLLGVVHLVSWLTAAEVHVTEMYGRPEVRTISFCFQDDLI